MTAAGADAARATFLRLLEEFEPPLRRLTGGYAADAADREDLFQDIAVALWGAIPGFRGESSERTWVYRIAHNTALTWKGKSRRRRHTEREDEAPHTHPDGRPHPEQQTLNRERRERLTRLIRAMPPPDRQIVLLYLEELSTRDIAEVAGLSENAAATRLSRIRTRLAERIQQQEAPR
jgi:RNA polymerase sigma-70 factor (ECF subfamily)